MKTEQGDPAWSVDAMETWRLDEEIRKAGEIPIFVRCWRPEDPNKRVLLVHGASAGGRTFMIPDGGLIRYLCGRRYEVWTLDWRGSNLVNERIRATPRSAPHETGTLTAFARGFHLDASVEDLSWALEKIVEGSKAPGPLGVVAHCIGGGLVAQAIAQGSFGRTEKPIRIGNVVLTTLALFYRVGFDGWLKGNDYVLEELVKSTPLVAHPTISPWVAGGDPEYDWPDAFEELFEEWDASPLPHQCSKEFCHRASFMFGMPYRPNDMLALHDTDAPNGLWAQFGDMPLVLYMHCVQNLRRGFAAEFDAVGLGDTIPLTGSAGAHRHTHDANYLKHEPFVGAWNQVPPRRLTLITGAENQVWHRDSVDRMHEWLINQQHHDFRGNFQKHVLFGYGHQDLYWSSRARSEVYPLIADGLEAALIGRESTPARASAARP